VSLFILAWLGWQVSVPLSYYVRGGVQEDQRFSWRMFSQVWLASKSCNVVAFEVVAPSSPGGASSVRRLDLWDVLHPIWVEQARQNRGPLLEKFLRARCDADPSVVEAQFMRTCPVAPGLELPEVDRRLRCHVDPGGPPRTP
jgi:hypothetical protein